MSASSLRSVRCVRHPMPGRRASSVPAARGAEADPAASVRAGGAAYRRQGAAGSLHPGRSRAAPGRSIRGLMWLDAAVLALIAWLGWAGARAGAEVAGVRLLGLPLARSEERRVGKEWRIRRAAYSRQCVMSVRVSAGPR